MWGPATVRIVGDVPGPHGASATECIRMTDAYLVGRAVVTEAPVAAARDGVDVRLLPPARTELPAIRAPTRVGYRELPEAGARIREWRGPMIQAQTIVVDDRRLTLNSSNLNLSSLAANNEVVLRQPRPGGRDGRWSSSDKGRAGPGGPARGRWRSRRSVRRVTSWPGAAPASDSTAPPGRA